AGVDTQDLYMLHLNPDNPRQYEYNGEWHTIQSTTEIIPVNDAEPVVWQVQQTQFGPIVSNPQQRGQPLALRQMEIHADEFITAILQIDKATNWSSFQQALKYRGGAVQNYLYADIDGNIGLQMTGTIPVRTENHTWLVPVPGWNDEYLWESLHSFDEMPSVYNPASGWIIAANQPVDDTQMISTAPAWDAAFRFNRIETLLLESQNHNVDTFAAMQADVYDPFAALVMPMLLDLKFRFLPRSEDEAEEIATLRDYQTWMAAWDYENDMDSPQAALFAMIWVRLVDIIFDDQLHIDSGGGLAERQAVFTLDNSRWWDDIRTPEIIETRDMTLYRAFLEAIEDAEQQFDRLRDEWRWGDLHTTRFRSLLPGETGIAAIDELLNRGAVATGGGYSTLNTSGWSTERAHRYEVETAPVLRMIIDLNDFENSRSILATGQSGHPASPHYDDMIDLWRSVAYRDMLWERSTIQESSESTLRLRPALPDQLNP
ncbi:MAG TPA: penicillin acylase family protein, partial [Aggregatilineales bacterium]|nr:penicillin acylase family protein [Aggregatilineales bacterium]